MTEYRCIELKVEDGTSTTAICEILEHKIDEVKSAIARHPSMSETEKAHDLVEE